MQNSHSLSKHNAFHVDLRWETKTGHTKLCIGLQGFACFSKMGRVSVVMVGYVVDLEGSSRNF